MRVGNRPDGVAGASCLYANRRPVRGKGKGKSEYVKLSCEFFAGPLGRVQITKVPHGVDALVGHLGILCFRGREGRETGGNGWSVTEMAVSYG